MVTSTKLTTGVPGHCTQRGMGSCGPIRFAHSAAAPIGHNRPHQLRAEKITERKTSGNQSPQTAKLAKRAKLSNVPACSAGGGNKSGPTITAVKSTNMVTWT